VAGHGCSGPAHTQRLCADAEPSQGERLDVFPAFRPSSRSLARRSPMTVMTAAHRSPTASHPGAHALTRCGARAPSAGGTLSTARASSPSRTPVSYPGSGLPS
jgi:hypothetical protein